MVRFLALAVVGAASAAHAQSPATDTARCAVWQRELSFAQSVQQHDETSFAEHIENDAVFAANTAHPQRGRANIVKQWKPLLEGKTIRVSWYPAWVVQAGDPSVVLSSGPALLENLAPNAPHRYTLLSYSTVWHRGSDGQWRVMFDGGDEGHPATAQDVQNFEAGRRTECSTTLASLTVTR
jgi:ketosteroid isomerase-like protein